MVSRDNLRLVSFDGGGGARTFSQLRFMGQIMRKMTLERSPNESNDIILPCDHFDLMAGTGTGGLIVIMFAKLRMSVEEASDEFSTIVEEVYMPHRLSPSERTQKLRECMEGIMERKGLPIDMKLMEIAKPDNCASFVLASHRTDAANKVCLRSYPVRSQLASAITVVEAVLATCTTPPTFSSVTSGSGYNKTEYLGASLGATNPVREMITEAHLLFGGDSSVASLLSLGAGHPGAISFPSGDGVDLSRVMHEMMSDCEQRAKELERQIGRVGIYFRFSVEQGMQSDRLGPIVDSNQVLAQTESYIADERIREKIGDFIRTFDRAARFITLDQLEYAGGSTIAIESAATLEAILAALKSDHEDAILAKLKVADLESGPHTAECMPGTRRDILESINTWTMDLDAPNILWLKGYPGVGKSAIASSVVEQLRAAGRLGSQFFFQRQRSNVMTTNALWRTVAYDLAREYPTIRKHLVAALEADESIPTAFNVDRLFRQLIQDSLLAIQEVPVERLPVIVVDALDECGGLEGEHSSHRRKLVRTLQLWSSLPLKFKIIVTSRDESDITGVFLRTSHHPIEISAGRTVEAQSSEDIQAFLTHRFKQIAFRHPGSLSPDWPGPAVITRMASTAAGLFIWAETVIRFVNLGQAKERLGLVLEGNGTGDMTTLYEQILRTSFSSLRDDEVEDLCSVMGTVILAKAPLSFSTLAGLLSMDDSTVEQMCIGLQSVLDSQGVLTFHHQSFIDFLIDPARSTLKFFVRRKQETRNLTIACLTVMKSGLQFNICDLKTSYLRNAAVPDLASRVEARISPHLSYSTLFWSGHLAETTFDLGVFEDLQYFMDNQFLFWLEVLSLIKQVNVASSMLLMLINWLKISHQDDALARDMRRFITVFASLISQSASHIYLSALPFSPRNSAVSKQYREQFTRTIKIKTGGLNNWPAIQNVLSGHSSLVSTVAFSPDGIRIASGSWDTTIRVWDVETGEMVSAPFKGHSDRVNSVAFSPDRRWIVSGSQDKTVRVWDAETGETVAGPFDGHGNAVNSVAFSPDGKRIVSSSDDKTIRMCDAQTGEVIVGPFNGTSSLVNSVAFSRDGKRIVSGSLDATIHVWDAETGEVIAGPFKGHSGSVHSVSFSPDRKRIISCSEDKTVLLWDAETGEVDTGPLNAHSGVVTSVSFSPDGKRFVSGSNDNTIRVCDAKTGETIAGPFDGHGSEVRSVAFSPDGKRIVTGSNDQKVRVWDGGADEMVEGPVNRPRDAVTSVAFSPSGQQVVAGYRDSTIWVWDAEMGEVVAGPFQGHSDVVTSVAFSPNGKRVVSGSNDETIRVWNAETGHLITGPLNGHSAEVNSVAFSPDGMLIVSGSNDQMICVWDAEAGVVALGPLNGHGNSVNSVSFSPDGRRIVSGSWDSTVRVWDAETGEAVAGPFHGHSDVVTSVAFSPDGRRIASGSNDTTIRMWNAETGEAVTEAFIGHISSVNSISFSPDGKWILSGSWDSTVRVWDSETGKLVAGDFNGHSDWINSVAFSPDGKRIVTGSEDRTIRVWDAMVENSKSLTYISPSFNDSSVMEDGWILGSNSELLFWVPPTLREGLFWPNTRLVIGDLMTAKLDLTHFVHGELWSECKV